MERIKTCCREMNECIRKDLLLGNCTYRKLIHIQHSQSVFVLINTVSHHSEITASRGAVIICHIFGFVKILLALIDIIRTIHMHNLICTLCNCVHWYVIVWVDHHAFIKITSCKLILNSHLIKQLWDQISKCTISSLCEHLQVYKISKRGKSHFIWMHHIKSLSDE